MGTAERRAEIMRILCRRRHETISNLAEEFGVSTRTIQRDVEILSITESIYTRCGRYNGGIYVLQDYVMDRMYMTDCELSVLHKLACFAQSRAVCDLDKNEFNVLNRIISQYTKPKKERKCDNESKRKRAI